MTCPREKKLRDYSLFNFFFGIFSFAYPTGNKYRQTILSGRFNIPLAFFLSSHPTKQADKPCNAAARKICSVGISGAASLWFFYGASRIVFKGFYSKKILLPLHIRKNLKSGAIVFEWEDYKKKFGFCDIEPVRNPEAVAKYVTK